MKDQINYKHLERLFTCQKYFIWNSNTNKELELKEEDNADENEFWEIISDFDADDINTEYKYIEVIKNGFKIVNELFIKFIQNWAKKENKQISIIQEKNNDEASKKTFQELKNKNIDWIINPVFIHDNLIVKCSLYDKNKKEIYTLLNNGQTKLINYLKAYFDYNVLKKLNIEINEYFFINYDSKKDYQEAKELSFVYSKYCWTRKNRSSKESKTTIEEHNNNQSIIEKLKNGIICENKKQKIVLHENDFDFYISEICKSKNLTTKPSDITIQDITPWGTNPFFNDIFDFNKNSIPFVSGTLLKKQNLFNISKGIKNIDYFAKKTKALDYLLKKQNHFDFNEIKKYINRIKDKKVVWYDFEGFSMPFTILAHTKPYQQIVFQVSVIRTINEKIIQKENFVIDPKKISLNDFENIIEKIYWEEASTYVVYNQTYEISKLQNMVQLLAKKTIYEKVLEIERKTCDLYDLFRTNVKGDQLPKIFLYQLNGFSSIKNLEKYISENKYTLDVMIKPYKELNVKNGLMAMNKANMRYLDVIGDNEWKNEVEYLKQYCENDVKAMIMVYFFIKTLI